MAQAPEIHPTATAEIAQILARGILRLRERHARIATRAGEPVGLAIVAEPSVHGPSYPRPQEPV